MTDKQYTQICKDWDKKARARLYRGTRDDIVILAIPVKRRDRFLEGPVVYTAVPYSFPQGYFSSAWIAEAFELDDGDLQYVGNTEFKNQEKTNDKTY